MALGMGLNPLLVGQLEHQRMVTEPKVKSRQQALARFRDHPDCLFLGQKKDGPAADFVRQGKQTFGQIGINVDRAALDCIA